MTDGEKSAFIEAQTMMLRAEIEGMVAENQHRMSCGNSIAYGEEEFAAVREKYEPVIGYNAMLAMFKE